MAKNNGLTIFCANIIQENERMLHESCYKHQVEIKSKENFDKLFRKLNYICQAKSSKEDAPLNSAWRNKNVKSYIYGTVPGFPSGSWWGIRMDCSRDRVHDPFDESVQNGPFGVTSVCTMNTNLSEDVDYGVSLTLTGQKYVEGESNNDPLVKNYEDHIPVRLVRSYNLLNQFAPKTGYRYDGLYLVANFWIGINSDRVKYYKFALLRLRNQEPPLWNIKQSPSILNNPTSALHSTCTPVQSCSRNIASNVYEFKKYSHGSECTTRKGKDEKSNGFSQLTNADNKKLDEREKCMSESAIVTRHVFKKVNSNAECTSSMPSISAMSENKTLSLIGNQGSKTHNTNISIRTGLYNSSHSTQHDNKKNTSSPFGRTVKSLNMVKTNQHTENWNLSSKDKSRGLEGKSEFPKRVNYVSFHTVESKSAKTKFVKDSDAQVNGSTNDTKSTSSSKHESNIVHKEIINDTTGIRNGTPNSFDTPTNMLNITNCMYKNEFSAQKISHKEVPELKTLDSLDSLTPDKILHLINSKRHPLSKLLMGNMIGLTSEQSLALQTVDPITDQPDVKDKMVTQQNVTKDVKQRTNFEVTSDDLTASRCYKFRRRRKLSRRIMNKPEMIKYNKMHNEKLKKEFAQSSVRLGQHLTSFTKYNDSSKNIRKSEVYNDTRNEAVQQNQIRKKKPDYLRKSTRSIKRNVGNKRSEARVHLRALRTIDSSLKKRINKKQRREITNLLIDAKIGPKIRGPRYRRLRSINNTFTKQSYERSDSATCMLNTCKMNSERSAVKNRNALTKMTNCKRVKSKQNSSGKNETNTASLERNKTSSNLTMSNKKIDRVSIVKKGLSNENNNTNTNYNDNDNITNKGDNNKNAEHIENTVHAVENKEPSIIQNQKRKLIQAVYTEPKYTKIEGRLQKDISIPTKTDAVTQCSLIKEPVTRNVKSKDFVQNNTRSEQYTFIKIEYSDLKDTKSEVCEAVNLDDENKGHVRCSSDRRYVSCTEAAYNKQHSKNANVSLNSSIMSIREQKKCSSPERTSAFVPVNIPDNDLKIARLRSIGFKPINFCNSDEDVDSRSKGNKVMKQNVAEKYNKYTNEENDIVVYMDDELQYLDIENEDKNSLSARRKASDTKAYATIKEEQLSTVALQNDSFDSTLAEQDLESPWHGWKKVVTNKNTYWVGW